MIDITIYIAQWIRKGDGIYDPLNYARVDSSSKENALKRAKKAVEGYSTIVIMTIFTVKEYGELMAERLDTINLRRGT